jgi:hypothetical protein
MRIRPGSLPNNSLALGVTFELPREAFTLLTRGHESAGQDDKWSAYFRQSWLQIWRPDASGWFCYALRFDSSAGGTFSVKESWIGEEIRSATRGLGEDLATHRHIVVWLLRGLSGHDPGAFNDGVVHGTSNGKEVSFSGVVRSLEDVDTLSNVLLQQLIRARLGGAK